MKSEKRIHQLVKAAAFEVILTDKTLMNRVFMFLYKLQFRRHAKKISKDSRSTD